LRESAISAIGSGWSEGAAGSKGGRTTFERHGPKHMAEIGAKGFASLVANRFQGDRQGAIDWLHLQAHEAKLDSFVDRELARRLEQGEEVACIEMPVLSGPDDEVPF
jgi:hypothetical protein